MQGDCLCSIGCFLLRGFRGTHCCQHIVFECTKFYYNIHIYVCCVGSIFIFVYLNDLISGFDMAMAEAMAMAFLHVPQL